jgi:hypothetical protein
MVRTIGLGAGAALASLVLVIACSARVGGVLGGGACATNAQCKSGLCKGGVCLGMDCSCGATVCSESGTASSDCAPGWLCVHSFGNPLYAESASNSCMPSCGSCPANYTCTVADMRICDYTPHSGDASTE